MKYLFRGLAMIIGSFMTIWFISLMVLLFYIL